MSELAAWVVAECSNGVVQPATYETVAFALGVTGSSPTHVKIVVIGDSIEPVAQELSSRTGCTVLALKCPGVSTYHAETWLAVLGELHNQDPVPLILVPHTSAGWDFAPALAVKLRASCLSAVFRFRRDHGLTFTRQVCGGKLLEDVSPLEGRPAVVTVLPGAAEPVFPESGAGSGSDQAGGPGRGNAKQDPKGTSALSPSERCGGKVAPDNPAEADAPSPVLAQAGTIREVSLPRPLTRTRTLRVTEAPASTVNLRDAQTIVSAGRGIGSPEHLGKVKELASLFHRGAVGASRPLCDLGWLPLGHQVGMTGQTVSPKLYLACGISGMVQHTMGIRRAGLIVSINKDRRAPLMQIANYCVVADLRLFLPALVTRIRALQEGLSPPRHPPGDVEAS